jgi:hypothetical protein
MSPSAASLFDAETKWALGKLAEAVLPLQLWIEHKPKPPGPTPWRDLNQIIDPASLGAIEVLEKVTRETAIDASLRDRLLDIEHAPLTHFPFGDPVAWRTARNLDATARFTIFESENFLAIDGDEPVIRAEFYSELLPTLMAVVRTRNPQSFGEWNQLSVEFEQDNCPEWPDSTSRNSSTFLAQFTVDMLYGLMNMENDIPEPTKRAVLIELGEHRVKGKEWTRDEAQLAVEQLINVLESGAAPTPVPVDLVGPPIGTPPSFKTYTA